MAKNHVYADERLKGALLPGEELWWYGAPKPFRLFEWDTRKGILAKWIGSVMVVVLAVYFCSQTGKTLRDIILLPVILVVIVLSPLWERYTLLRYQYWITSHRVIIMTHDGSICAMDQELIDDCMIVRGGASGDCLILGSEIFAEAPKQLRWEACHPRTERLEAGAEGPTLGMVFYDLEDADAAAEQLLCRKLG